MTQKTRTRPARPGLPPLGPKIARLMREAGWLAVATASCFLVLVMLTYHPSDPAWSHSSTSAHVLNAGGPVGAWLSDVLFFLFGLSAWWLPVFLGAGIWRAWRRHSRKTPDEPRPGWVTAGGGVLLLLGCASLEAERLYQLKVALPLAPGGLIGDLVGGMMVRAAGFTGGTLFILFIMAVGFSLYSGMSWLSAMERLGGWLEEAWQVARGRAEAQAAARAAKRRDDPPKTPPVEAPTAPPLPEKWPPSDLPEAAPPAAVSDEAEVPARVRIEPAVTEIPMSPRVAREKQKPLFKDLPDSPLPTLALLDEAEANPETVSPETLETTSRLIERRLADFGVTVQVLAAYPGPVITRYEIEPATGVKGSQIVNLARDLARALSVMSIRVVETIPGKSCMGLEIPNPRRQVVRLSEIIGAQCYADMASPLTIAMGKDIAGRPVVADLAKMPHALVAGTTGSGKSVAINAMILSLLYKAEPSKVRLILVDPKMLELSIYEGIPHLLAPVVTDMKQASGALHWCVAEMERRYKLMSLLGVRNLAGCNQKIRDSAKAGTPLTNPQSLTPDNPEPLEEMPHIVVIIDELADLMMVVGKKVEELIARLAQKARAAGIHLVLATQRPSVDVITGLIKANIPTRVAFQVSSKIDSRTILDQMGAEALLGQGDMLFLPPGTGMPQRVHGAYVADDEVHRVVEYLKGLGEPSYIDGILQGGGDEGGGAGEMAPGGDGGAGEADPLYDEAVAIVLKTRRASISAVQRHLRIGYNRAARLIEDMEKAGLVSPMESNGSRVVLVPAENS